MGNIWGKKISLSIFGESHGEGIGIVIDGLPSGIELDLDEIQKEMDRRKPGNSPTATARKEADSVKILSGFFEGKTTGTPLCGVISNTDIKSKDYNKNLMRPGHADFTGFVKYNGFNDYRGGGHFSGRLTAPLVFAGGIAKQILNQKGIVIKAEPHISKDILEAKNNLDSVGGTISCCIEGVKAGLGDPFFDSIESTISSIMFSIPAVKGIEFGAGFKFADMYGSEANDEIYIDNSEVRTYTNNNGGINGGITNGMPIIFNLVIKPTPSIGKTQKTVDMEKRENTEIEVKGRHDPCIVERAVPVVEACTALAILEVI